MSEREETLRPDPDPGSPLADEPVVEPDAATPEEPVAEELADEEPAAEGPEDEETEPEDEAARYLELAKRTQADFENYRKRMARENAVAADRGAARLAKELLPALDHLAVDLLRRLRQLDPLVHVLRPLGRAHAHHLPLGALVPAPAAFSCELFAGRVPDVLGVDENAVQVEDHSPDHDRTR